MGKVHDEVRVVRALARNKEVSVDTVNKTIKVSDNPTTVGNGTYGKIDFLCHYCGYVFSVGKVSNKPKTKSDDNDNAPKKITKKEKREQKIMIAQDVKKTFKKKIKLS